MAWLGIDPGLDGAVALVQPDGSVRFWDTPFVEVEGKAKTKAGNAKVRTLYDRAAMASIIASANLIAQDGIQGAVIESVHSMPKQGVASSFKFGMGFGIWLGILAAKMLPHDLVDPRRWTRALLADMPKGDEAAVVRAGELYPAVSSELRTPRGRLLLGRADALLLAHYARVRRPVPGLLSD
jgi:crossover junction endodeoxyribonuclease RuvC